MRLEELTEKSDEKGTYAGVRFDDQTVKSLQKYIKDNKIPNAIAAGKMHCTLLYSKKHLPEYKPSGDIDPPMKGTPTDLEKWKSQPDDDGNVSQCLVLKFDCDELVERHKKLMDEHKATFGYDEYKTHVTLSYDIGDMEIKDLPPVDIKELIINKEYGEELSTDWAKKK